MHNPSDIMHFAPQSVPSRRYAAVAFVGALHIALIYALVTGLMPPVFTTIPTRAIDTRVITVAIEKPKPVPKPVEPTLAKPAIDTAPPPVVRVELQTPVSIDLAPSRPQPVIDSAAAAIAGTHSTPPYPPFARRLGHEGVVQLRIMISPEGKVVGADVVRSSGYAELDEAASSWVLAHWRYRPAMRGTLPVATTALAAVRFNLETAR